MTPDFDPAAGSWNEYAKLVLSELQRLNTNIETLTREVASTIEQQKLDRQAFNLYQLATDKQIETINRLLNDPHIGVVPRLVAVEQIEAVASTASKVRRGFGREIYLAIFALVVSVIAPVLNYLLTRHHH